jgi:hypothetical protein
MPSEDWLREFTDRLIEARGNASEAARYMGSDFLGVGGYYRTKGSQWANGSKLRRAVQANPELRSRVLAALSHATEWPERKAANLAHRLVQDCRSRLPAECAVSRGPGWCVREWMRGRRPPES